MVSGYFLLAIFVIIVFSLTHENSQYSATASAIRQVWTGDCRLGCQPSRYSDGGMSGLSALDAPTGSRSESCVCESCPCAHIEDFLKRCRPATQLYTTSTDVVSQYYHNLTKRLLEAFNQVSRVLECRTSCRRHAQLVHSRSNFDSTEDFKIVEKKDEKQISGPVTSVSGIARQYGDELAHKLLDLASQLSTSTQPVPPLPRPPRQEKPTAPHQEMPAGPSQMIPSTSFKTRPPIPPPKKRPDPPQNKQLPPLQEKPAAASQVMPADPPQVKQPPPLQDKPAAAPQVKPPDPVQDKVSQTMPVPSPQMTPSYDNSTATKQSSMVSSAKPSSTSTKTSVNPEEQTNSQEPNKASKPMDPKQQKSEDSPVEDTINCSKCVEEGKICIKGCPSADTRREKRGQ